MQRLLEQLLTLARADDGVVISTRQDVDLDDLALVEAARLTATDALPERSSPTAGPSSAERAAPTVRTSGIGAGRVHGDATALAQVVRNLMDNAARHARTTVAVAVRDTGGVVELIVEDDGGGISPDRREQVFERFARLDEARDRDAGGSGLGLAIVREIVTAHGGTVTITDSDLGGARFVVRFPS